MTSINVIITHTDERHNLEKCLKSIKETGDEFYLIDSVNSQKVKELCRSNGVKYLKDEISLINSGPGVINNKVTDEYFFVIGSNEYLSGNLNNNLSKLRNKLKSDVYRFAIRKNYYGRWMKHSGLYPLYEARLFKRLNVIWTDNTLKLKPEAEINAAFETITGEIYSMVYSSIYNHINQINKSTETEAEMLLSIGSKTSTLKIIFKPLLHFVKLFFVKLGFLDGLYGLVNAVISAYSDFLVQVKLKFLRKVKGLK
jgi:hypothetical protein